MSVSSEHADSAFGQDGKLMLGNNEDLIEENMSRLGKVIHNQDYDLWKSLNLDSVTFIAIVTHEIRRSGTYEVVMPYARINDGKMWVCGFKDSSKIEMLIMMSRVAQGKGQHVKMQKYFYQDMQQVRLDPSTPPLI
jgi:hypothetical protein